MVAAGAAAGAVHGAGDVWELRVGGLDRRAGAGQAGGGGGQPPGRAAGLVAARVALQLAAVAEAFSLVANFHPLAGGPHAVLEGQRAVLQGKRPVRTPGTAPPGRCVPPRHYPSPGVDVGNVHQRVVVLQGLLLVHHVDLPGGAARCQRAALC